MPATETPPAPPTHPSGLDEPADLGKPWAPLKIPAYRSFWIAGLISNMGTWMHETGAQWLMTSLEPRPEMVAAVRTCMTVPVFCLALPAGVWADWCDRRTWLIATQLLLLAIATAMATLAYLQMLSPWMLLAFTAAMGVGMILNQPAWQSLTPELVPPALVPSAVSIGSVSFNLARSMGPALAGILIAQAGEWAAFGFNACSFLAVVVVLLSWKPVLAEEARSSKRPEFTAELKKGLYVIRNSPELRNTLLRLFAFAVPACILWSLLSLVATEKLQFAERGFGVCLGVIGLGAVLGGVYLPWVRQRVSSETIVVAAQLVYGLMCVLIGFAGQVWLVVPSLLVLGVCWMATMTTFNATAQVYLPRKFRARGMAAFMMAFASGMALGSATWGWLARATNISVAFVVAGCLLAVVAIVMHSYKIGTLQVASAAR